MSLNSQKKSEILNSEEFHKIMQSKGQEQIRIKKETWLLIDEHIKGTGLNVNSYASRVLTIAILNDIDKQKN